MWPPGDVIAGRFPKETRLATGVEISGDFNNRLAYNEREDSIATLEDSLSMIDLAADAVFGLARRFGGTYA
jgi:hypothetical protein